MVEKFVVEYKYKTDDDFMWSGCGVMNMIYDMKIRWHRRKREREKEEVTEFWNTKQIDATVIQYMPVVVYEPVFVIADLL